MNKLDYDVVLFDLDGTLTDSIDGIVNAVTGVTDERVDDWKPTTDEEGNPLPSPGEETIEIGQGEQKPYQIGKEGEEGNEYHSA